MKQRVSNWVWGKLDLQQATLSNFPVQMQRSAVVGIDLGTVTPFVAVGLAKPQQQDGVVNHSSVTNTTSPFVPELLSAPPSLSSSSSSSLSSSRTTKEILRETRGLAEKLLVNAGALSAEGADKATLSKVVVAVPGYWDQDKRMEVKEIGLSIGLDVMRLVNEPTCILRSLSKMEEYLRSVEERMFLVCDIGSSHCDVTVIEMCHGVFEVRCSLTSPFEKGTTTQEVTSCSGSSSADPGGEVKQHLFAKNIPSQEFIRSCVVKALEEGELRHAEVDEVVIAGIGAKRSDLCEAISSVFFSGSDKDNVIMTKDQEETSSRPFQRSPLIIIPERPEEAVAKGAAIVAQDLTKAVRSIILMDEISSGRTGDYSAIPPPPPTTPAPPTHSK